MNRDVALPKSWVIAQLNDLSEVHYGKALPEKNRIARGDVPVVGSSGVVGRHNAALISDNCVVVGRKGAAGAVHLIAGPCWPIDTAYFLQPPEGLDIRWLSHALGTKELAQLDKSTAIPSLSRDDLHRVLVPVAPRAEQTRILEKLEELLSDLDAGVAELKAAQKKLAQYRQSLLKAAVEGSLTADWRKRNKPTETGAQLLQRILTERRARWEAKQLAKFNEQGNTPPKDWQKKYPEPVQPESADLPELPEGWVWATVDCLLSGIETGKSFKCVERPPTADETGVVKVSAVSWGEYDEQESKTCTDEERVSPELMVKSGDFLFSRANTVELVGACVIAKKVSLNVMLSDKILRLVLVLDELKPWLLYLLRSKIGRRQIELLATGNQESMKNIGQERLRSIAIPLGPKGELDYAIALVEQELTSASQQISANEFGLKQATAQRQNILRAAFSGQLVPQDPNDEPASVLLARIRAERAAAAVPKHPRTRLHTRELA